MMLFPVKDPGDSQLAFSIISEQKGDTEDVSLCEKSRGVYSRAFAHFILWSLGFFLVFSLPCSLGGASKGMIFSASNFFFLIKLISHLSAFYMY